MDCSKHLNPDSQLIPFINESEWPEDDQIPEVGNDHDMTEEAASISKLSIKPKQKNADQICEFVDKTHFTKKGCLVQFINTNCAGSSSIIGGVRLGISDVNTLPAYLSKWKQHMRLHGIKMLARHLVDTHCPTGVGETLFPEDYGISFTVASLSPKGV